MVEAKEQIQLIYTTEENLSRAHQLGKKLVEEKLAGCVNLIPVVESIYHWEGKIECGQEVTLFIKTTRERTDEVVDRIRELHSYDCPAILLFPVISINEDYTDWLKQQTKAD